MSKELSLQETGAMLLAAEKIVLCTHVSPDGDTLGSTLGLARFCWHRANRLLFSVMTLSTKALAFFPVLNCVNAR